MFPLVYYQAGTTIRMGNAKDDVKRLSETYRAAIANAPNEVRMKKAKIYWRGLRAAWRKHRANPLSPFLPIAVQIPCFVTFVLSWRSLIQDEPTLKTGGAMWFTDLTVADETMILPIATLSLAYLSIQIAGSKTSESPGKFVPWLLDSVSLLLIASGPFVMILPQGVFMYWLTSSSLGMIQSAMLRNPAIRAALRIPTRSATTGTTSP